MSFFPKAPLIAGIIMTPHSFLVALIKKKRGGFDLLSLEEWPLTTHCQDKLPKEAAIITSLPSKAVLVRPLELPLKKEKDLESAYRFQAEPLLPYPAEKGVIQKITARQQGEGTLLTILAARKDHIDAHLTTLNEKGILPDTLTSTGFALSCLARQLPPSFEPQIWIELRDTVGTVALIEDGKLLMSRACERDPSEIQKSVLAISAAYKNKKIETIYLIAEGDETLAMVQECTQKNVVIPKINCASENDLKKYGAAIGLALTFFDKNCPNFLLQEQRVARRIKRLKKPLVTYFALATLLFITLAAFEREVLLNRQTALLNRGAALFHEGTTSITSLEEKLEKYQKEIAKIPDTFQLYPQIPKVRDLLAHLSNEIGNRIEIEELSYKMATRPDFDRKNEKYKVVVEMIFTCPSQEEASSFREALSSSSFVDSNKEIEWVTNKGKYKISFNLKDKTRYS